MGTMSKAELDAFLARPLLARIGTVQGDRPHVVPMWFDWDGESIWMESGLDAQKTKNLTANPNCIVVVDETEGGLRFQGVTLAGHAELVSGPPDFVRETTIRIYEKYLGREALDSPTPRRMIENPHLLIKLTPSRMTTWDQTSTGLAPLL